MHAILSIIVNSDTILFRESKTHTLIIRRECLQRSVLFEIIVKLLWFVTQFDSKKSAISKLKELK